MTPLATLHEALSSGGDVLLALAVTFVPAALVIGDLRRQATVVKERRQRTSELQRQESTVAEEAKEHGGLELASLWPVTQQRIDFYHEIALEQSRKSFRNGQIAMTVGFIAVVGVGFLAAFAKNGTASIAAAAVGVAGAAMSALIGATFLRSQAEATSQLRQFFSQPVELLRVLGAERLLHSLPDQERAAAVEQIIKSMTLSRHDSSSFTATSSESSKTTE